MGWGRESGGVQRETQTERKRIVVCVRERERERGKERRGKNLKNRTLGVFLFERKGREKNYEKMKKGVGRQILLSP